MYLLLLVHKTDVILTINVRNFNFIVSNDLSIKNLIEKMGSIH